MGAFRKTKQKETIKKVVDDFKTFFSAQDVYDKVCKLDDSIGIATVYRYLKVESDNQNLHSYVCDRKQVYSKNKTHCHFVDEETGEISHFSIDSIDFLNGKIKGDISSISIEVKGKKK